MKNFKVYSNACTKVYAVEEISAQEAKDIIADEIMAEEFPEKAFAPYKGIDWDNDEEVNRAYEETTERAYAYFEEKGFYECGDFAIIAAEEEPERANCYGSSNGNLYSRKELA